MIKKLLTLLLLLPTFVFAQSTIPQGGTGWATSSPGEILFGTTSKLRYSRLPIGTTGQVLWVLNGNPAWVSTSSLGISGGGGSGTVTSVSLTAPTGLTAASTTCTAACILNLTLTGGYVIPLIASTTQWSGLVDSPVWRVGNGTIYNATSTNKVGIGTTNPLTILHVTPPLNCVWSVAVAFVKNDELAINNLPFEPNVHIALLVDEAIVNSDAIGADDVPRIVSKDTGVDVPIPMFPVLVILILSFTIPFPPVPKYTYPLVDEVAAITPTEP